MGWKRLASLISLACSVLVMLFYFLLVFQSDLILPFKVILYVLGGCSAAGLIVLLFFYLVKQRHVKATLITGPNGCVNIELAALRSVAVKSLEPIDVVKISKVVPKVINKKGDIFIDFRVDVVYTDSGQLAMVAENIQRAVKSSVSYFSGHEVRNVTVNFVNRVSKDKDNLQEDRLLED